MSTQTAQEIIYPDSNGEPMSDNSIQFRWIVTIMGNLDALFRDDPDVFVAGDMSWYPVEGNPAICMAPDALVAFGRPKGDRGSYMQWIEAGIAPQVVFEVLSPKNYRPEMERKLEFYDQYGVEEYYEFDPNRTILRGWVREGEHLRVIPQTSGWTSPLLGIRFVLDDDLTILAPNGRPFEFVTAIFAGREEAERRAERERIAAERDRIAAERERIAAEQANLRAERERIAAEEANRRAERERIAAEEANHRAEDERRRADRLAERLRSLGLDLEE